MISKDLQSYAEVNWGGFLSPVSVLSKGGEVGETLKTCQECLYNFDNICGSLCFEDKKPASVDGISVKNEVITLVEFKSGFKDKISVEKFDPEEGKCNHLGAVCEPFWDQFHNRRDAEKKVLLSSICMKAIESFVLLEKQVLPLCLDLSGAKLSIRLLVVVEDDGTDAMVDMLSRQSKENSRSTIYNRIKESLKRLNVVRDALGNDYYFDRIDVISAIEFRKKAKELAIEQ